MTVVHNEHSHVVKMTCGHEFWEDVRPDLVATVCSENGGASTRLCAGQGHPPGRFDATYVHEDQADEQPADPPDGYVMIRKEAFREHVAELLADGYGWLGGRLMDITEGDWTVG